MNRSIWKEPKRARRVWLYRTTIIIERVPCQASLLVGTRISSKRWLQSICHFIGMCTSNWKKQLLMSIPAATFSKKDSCPHLLYSLKRVSLIWSCYMREFLMMNRPWEELQETKKMIPTQNMCIDYRYPHAASYYFMYLDDDAKKLDWHICTISCLPIFLRNVIHSRKGYRDPISNTYMSRHTQTKKLNLRCVWPILLLGNILQE